MTKEETLIPVYICTGLLDSGKTTFIRETLMEQEWLEAGLTLLIQCEEGEYELEPAYLKKKHIDTVTVEAPEDLTPAFLRELQKTRQPAQIIIEFNGMWNLQEFLQTDFPEEWGLAGIYSTVDGQQLESCMKNMRNIFLNQLIESDLIVVNRCGADLNRATFRKAIKLQDPQGQIIFEALDGSIIEFSEDDLPYDLSQPVVEITDADYGTWYSDAFENPDRYKRRKFRFLAQLFRPVGMPKSMFVPGRLVMACCAADIKFYGFPCKSDTVLRFEQKSWYRVTVEFSTEMKTNRRSGETLEAPVLRLVTMEPAEKPAEEVVNL